MVSLRLSERNIRSASISTMIVGPYRQAVLYKPPPLLPSICIGPGHFTSRYLKLLIPDQTWKVSSLLFGKNLQS